MLGMYTGKCCVEKVTNSRFVFRKPPVSYNGMNIAVFVLCTGVIACVSSLTLDIEPKKKHVFPLSNVTVLCTADGPLSACQFKWKNHWSEGPLIDLSQGPASPNIGVNLTGDITAYWYHGSGLQNGQCGAVLNVGRWGSRVIGCRGRSDTGGWVYADMTVQVDSRTPFPLIPDPRESVVLEGATVNLMCQAPVPLTDCTFSLPGKELVRFNLGPQSEASSIMKYYGTGLGNGQCGATLLNVNEDVNGRVLCAGKTEKKGEYELSSTTVIIARAPTSVELKLTKPTYTEGETMEATCTVRDSRPAANLTWYLGAEMIRHDEGDDSPIDSHWSWRNESRAITQKVVRQLTREDNGKELRCVAEHIALPNQILQSRILSVEYEAMCPPLNSTSVDIFCVFGADVSSCGVPMAIGTVAYLQCKTGYQLNADPGYRSINCRAKGVWDKNVFICDLDCGRRNTNAGATLISNGTNAKMGEFPWHVAIYEESEGSYVQICGGTLITPKLVMSAAHCFYNNIYKKKCNESLYKVAAGKYHREWDIEEKPVPSQRRDVKEIILDRRYKGRETNFVLDIAVLRLSTALDITLTVKVVCIDWDNLHERLALRSGQFGTVVGWGYTESGQQSDKLKLVDLPFIPFEICYAALPSELKQIFTPDKFCAGYVNKSTSVCGGDSGGGIVFQEEASEKYYLRGIVSVAFKPSDNNDICYAQSYTAFTQFSQFRTWVQDML